MLLLCGERFAVPLANSKCFSLLGMPNRDGKEISQGGSNVCESLHDNLPL